MYTMIIICIVWQLIPLCRTDITEALRSVNLTIGNTGCKFKTWNGLRITNVDCHGGSVHIEDNELFIQNELRKRCDITFAWEEETVKLSYKLKCNEKIDQTYTGKVCHVGIYQIKFDSESGRNTYEGIYSTQIKRNKNGEYLYSKLMGIKILERISQNTKTILKCISCMDGSGNNKPYNCYSLEKNEIVRNVDIIYNLFEPKEWHIAWKLNKMRLFNPEGYYIRLIDSTNEDLCVEIIVEIGQRLPGRTCIHQFTKKLSLEKTVLENLRNELKLVINLKSIKLKLLVMFNDKVIQRLSRNFRLINPKQLNEYGVDRVPDCFSSKAYHGLNYTKCIDFGNSGLPPKLYKFYDCLDDTKPYSGIRMVSKSGKTCHEIVSGKKYYQFCRSGRQLRKPLCRIKQGSELCDIPACKLDYDRKESDEIKQIYYYNLLNKIYMRWMISESNIGALLLIHDTNNECILCYIYNISQEQLGKYVKQLFMSCPKCVQKHKEYYFYYEKLNYPSIYMITITPIDNFYRTGMLTRFELYTLEEPLPLLNYQLYKQKFGVYVNTMSSYYQLMLFYKSEYLCKVLVESKVQVDFIIQNNKTCPKTEIHKSYNFIKTTEEVNYLYSIYNVPLGLNRYFGLTVILNRKEDAILNNFTAKAISNSAVDLSWSLSSNEFFKINSYFVEVRENESYSCVFIYLFGDENLYKDQCKTYKMKRKIAHSVQLTDLKPLTNYSITLKTLNKGTIRYGRKLFVMTKNSFEANCFLDCAIKNKGTLNYTGLQRSTKDYNNCNGSPCRANSKFSVTCKSNYKTQTCLVPNCPSELEELPTCVAAKPNIVTYNSIKGGWGPERTKHKPLSYIVLLHDKNDNCLASYLYGSTKLIDYDLPIRGLFIYCDTVNLTETITYEYEFTNLTPSTKYMVYIFYAISKESAGKIRRISFETKPNKIRIKIKAFAISDSSFVVKWTSTKPNQVRGYFVLLYDTKDSEKCKHGVFVYKKKSIQMPDMEEMMQQCITFKNIFRESNIYEFTELKMLHRYKVRINIYTRKYHIEDINSTTVVTTRNSDNCFFHCMESNLYYGHLKFFNFEPLPCSQMNITDTCAKYIYKLNGLEMTVKSDMTKLERNYLGFMVLVHGIYSCHSADIYGIYKNDALLHKSHFEDLYKLCEIVAFNNLPDNKLMVEIPAYVSKLTLYIIPVVNKRLFGPISIYEQLMHPLNDPLEVVYINYNSISVAWGKPGFYEENERISYLLMIYVTSRAKYCLVAIILLNPETKFLNQSVKSKYEHCDTVRFDDLNSEFYEITDLQMSTGYNLNLYGIINSTHVDALEKDKLIYTTNGENCFAHCTRHGKYIGYLPNASKLAEPCVPITKSNCIKFEYEIKGEIMNIVIRREDDINFIVLMHAEEICTFTSIPDYYDVKNSKFRDFYQHCAKITKHKNDQEKISIPIDDSLVELFIVSIKKQKTLRHISRHKIRTGIFDGRIPSIFSIAVMNCVILIFTVGAVASMFIKTNSPNDEAFHISQIITERFYNSIKAKVLQHMNKIKAAKLAKIQEEKLAKQQAQKKSIQQSMIKSSLQASVKSQQSEKLTAEKAELWKNEMKTTKKTHHHHK